MGYRFMKIFFQAFIINLAFSFSLHASLSEDLPEINYETFKLENGLTVIVHQDKKVPMVAVNVWYHVGSKNEKAGKTGFAHFFEHMAFKGSKKYPSAQVLAERLLNSISLRAFL